MHVYCMPGLCFIELADLCLWCVGFDITICTCKLMFISSRLSDQPLLADSLAWPILWRREAAAG